MGKRKETKFIVFHCTASQPDATVASIKAGWKKKGWKNPGYFALVASDGTIEYLADEDNITNGAKGYNYCSVHVAYIGGIDENGNGMDTRTSEQKESLRKLLTALKKDYPDALVIGHRDLSPDLDGDGEIEPHEWIKLCPSFEVSDWLEEVKLKNLTDVVINAIKKVVDNTEENE